MLYNETMKYITFIILLVLGFGGLVGVYLYFYDPVADIAFAPNAHSVKEGIPKVERTYSVRTIARDLSVPWELAFLSDRSMLVTERAGTLVRIYRDGSRATTTPPTAVRAEGEGGLLGMALHPEYEENSYLYLYQTQPSGNGTKNAVIRYVYDEATHTLTEPVTIVDNIPGAQYHDGGRLAFGPDGKLYITTGDAGKEDLAQDINSFAGKILRYNDDGTVPSDNPFGNGVWSYGHRNPQGLAWDSQGVLWSTEHGRSGIVSGYDELNKIERRGNYGWPIVQGDQESPGTNAPLIHSGSDTTWAPASLVYYNGSFFFGGLRGEGLYEARYNGELELVRHFAGLYGRIRTVVEGPDDALYFTTSNTDGRGNVREGDDIVVRLEIAPY